MKEISTTLPCRSFSLQTFVINCKGTTQERRKNIFARKGERKTKFIIHAVKTVFVTAPEDSEHILFFHLWVL